MPHRLSGHAALDSLSNLAASLNAGKDKQAGDAFFIPALARDQIESLYRGDWLARKIVDIVPYDCVREWRAWAGEAGAIARVKALEARLNLRRAVQRAMVMGRLYGGGALIIGTRESDPAALAAELRPEAIGENGLAFLHAVSRWQLAVDTIERDPLSPWFGEPKSYQVVAPERGTLTLHPSRVIRFLGAPLADPALMGADLWSDSVLTALYDAIHAVALTTTGATSLMHEAKVDVVTVPNLSEHLSNAATTAQLSARFSYAAAMKSLNNLLLLGDGETWARQRVDFAGLPEMVRTFLQVAAGAADIPVTRLLGQSPAGLSATGDSDIRNYYDMIAARQEIDLRPQLERLDRLLMASAGLEPGALSFSFCPLWQMDAATKAATALQKAQATAIYAGLDLWPKAVMAGLVAGQIAEDGIYPDAGAAFEAVETEGAPQPVRDYSPDQPRDPQGRWTEGGGTATIGAEGVAGNGVTAETPRSLTIHPKANRPLSSEGTHLASRSGTTPAILAAVGNALEFLNPISSAHAAGPEEDENRSVEGEADPMSEIREDLYYSAYNELKAIDPKNLVFERVYQPSNWRPSNEDVRRVQTALELARSSQARSSPITSPRQEPDTVSPFAPTSEQVNRAAPEPPTPMPRSPVEEMLESIARENPFRFNVGRAAVPEGGFGSIVRTNGVIISVTGNSPRELGYSYEQGIRNTFGSGKSGGSFIAQIGRTVDDVFEEQVLEAKHIKMYMESIYNPRSAEPWQRPALDALVKQAREITRAYDGGAIYFTNDEKFAREYTEIFQQNGISKFRFVIAPSSVEEAPR